MRPNTTQINLGLGLSDLEHLSCWGRKESGEKGQNVQEEILS
uniref:Uncharacterized protein n=1 Tax=Rhizophora mucronata TaxID=61149 RepID=A0A2P2IMW5_RHIMU